MRNELNEELEYRSGLLLEAGELKGSFGKVMGKWKERVKKFGKTLAAAAKLVTNDIAYMVKLTFSFRAKTINEARKKHKQRRNSLIKTLDQSVQDSLGDSDARFVAFALAPSVMATSAAFGVVGKPFDPEFRKSVGEWGGDKLPWPMNVMFTEDFNRGDFLTDLASAKDQDEFNKLIAQKLGQGPDKKGGGGLSTVALALTSIFLVKEGKEDEPENDSKPNASTEEMLDKWFMEQMEENMPDNKEEFLEMKEQELQEVFKGAPEMIDAVVNLTMTEDPKEFLSIIGKLKKAGGEKTSSMDISKIQKGMEDMAEKLESDAKSMEQIKKDIAKSKGSKITEGNEGVSDKEVKDEIRKVIMVTTKSQFVQTTKEELGDYMEKAYSFLWDGLSDEQINTLKKTEAGKRYFDLCSNYDKQFEEAISKLKNA